MTAHPTNDSPASVEEPTVEWLIDQIAPNTGNSPLVNYNKQRLAARINQLLTEARIDEHNLTRRHYHPDNLPETFDTFMLNRLAELRAALKDGGKK